MKESRVRSLGWLNWLQFQINRDFAHSTVDSLPVSGAETKRSRPISRWLPLAWIEIGLIWLFFIGLAGQAVPHVNEAHYLAKAKYFWNPDWCPNDLFLASSFSHWLFYASFGWITKFFSLEVFAWTGRITTWFFLAWAWRRLSWQLIPVPIVASLTAILFYLLNDRFQLAGEWVIGGFEAKGIAYGCLIWGLSELASGNWKRVWLACGLAAAFHVLVGAWGGVAITWVWLVERRRQVQLASKRRGEVTGAEFLSSIRSGLKDQRWSMLLAFALLGVGAIPPILADWGTPAEVSLVASRMYVLERLSHHLHFGGFPVGQIARFTVMVAVWFALRGFLQQAGNKLSPALVRVLQFAFASLLVSLGGLILSGLASETSAANDLAIRLLKLYWFRLSDFAVPATLALMLGWIIAHWWNLQQELARRTAAGFAVALIFMAGLLQIWENQVDPRPVADQRALPKFEAQPEKDLQLFHRWKQVCAWIAEHTPSDAQFITPAQQQTFKWYAHRAEVVCWKDVPQDAQSLLQWMERVDELVLPQQRYELGLMSFSDDQLRDLAKKYRAQYLLVPQWQVDAADGTDLKQVYPTEADSKSAFVVFEF